MATQDTPSDDLSLIHRQLIELNKKLLASLSDPNRANNPALTDATVTEMREVVHRIDLVQKLIFTQASNDISTAAGQIAAANTVAINRIGQIKSVIDLVNTVTSVLSLVDQAIDLAKVAAIA